MIHPIDRIRSVVPAIFFERVLEGANAAFGEAAYLAAQYIDEPERQATQGQLRHARSEDWFRKAAREAGLATLAHHTEPKGGRYSVAWANGIYIIRSNIQSHTGVPRPTAFRRALAAFNKWLDPIQPDLLSRPPAPAQDRLCCMLVTTRHPSHEKERSDVPAFVGLGVPTADLSDWHRLISIPDLLATYHVTEAGAPMLEPPVSIKDRAQPKLRKID